LALIAASSAIAEALENASLAAFAVRWPSPSRSRLPAGESRPKSWLLMISSNSAWQPFEQNFGSTMRKLYSQLEPRRIAVARRSTADERFAHPLPVQWLAPHADFCAQYIEAANAEGAQCK
jgi:hypothetical protein